MKRFLTNRAYIPIACCIILLVAICAAALSDTTFPNFVSNTLNYLKNNGVEQQVMEERSNLKIIESLEVSNRRSSYPNLDDQEFANYHEIEALGLKPKTLYKSASPLGSDSDRANIVQDCIKKDKIANFINLEDHQDIALQTKWYTDCNNYQNNTLFAPIDDNMQSEQTKISVFKIFKYIEKTDTPILVHCHDGGTKTGIVCALLQVLNASGYDYLKANYINSLKNLYVTDQDIVSALDMKFRNKLAETFNLTSHNVIYLNLNKYAIEYLKSCDLDEQTINNVKEKLKA